MLAIERPTHPISPTNGPRPLRGLSPTELGARELAAQIARGERSAVDVVRAHIARIEAVNPALNAVVVPRFEAALAEAAEVDRRRRAGEPLGPLAGVPITVKECLDLEGTPSTFGLTVRANHRATADEVHVARLRRAGAIVLGKTNASQLLIFVETDNPLYGRTNHPIDGERSPGGSSGGEGAIIAAGGSALGLGTDVGGSCRIPAAFSGVVGFKPTAGRAPDLGTGSIPIGEQAIASQVGVLARSVDDAWAALEIAIDARSGAPGTIALGNPSTVDVAKLRVGYFEDDGVFRPSPGIRRAVRDAAAKLGALGAKVEPWTPPSPEEAEALFYGIVAADGARGMTRALAGGPQDPRVKQILASGKLPAPLMKLLLGATGRGRAWNVVRNLRATTTDEYWRRVEALVAYRARVLADLRAKGPFDVVLSPTAGLVAVRHGATAELGVMGTYTLLYNVLGWPAGVVPCDRVRPGEESDRPTADVIDRTAKRSEEGSAGLPIGVQVAATPWMDHVAIAVMRALAA